MDSQRYIYEIEEQLMVVFCKNFSCNEGDMNKLHREEMLKAATEARDKYLQDHPEAADINLKYDPLQHIEECKYSERHSPNGAKYH